MKKLILIGAGGHSKVIQDIVKETREIELYAILDDGFQCTWKSEGLIYSKPSLINTLQLEDFMFCIAIGNNTIRKKLFKSFQIPIKQYMTLIHPTAVISESAKIGRGTVVMPNAIINADAVIGNHCIVNSGSVVEHDNELEDYVHISPNATLAGTVSIAEGAHIGSGATIIPDKRVGRWTIIGAGTVLVDNIGDELTVVGVPGKVIKKN